MRPRAATSTQRTMQSLHRLAEFNRREAARPGREERAARRRGKRTCLAAHDTETSVRELGLG